MSQKSYDPTSDSADAAGSVGEMSRAEFAKIVGEFMTAAMLKTIIETMRHGSGEVPGKKVEENLERLMAAINAREPRFGNLSLDKTMVPSMRGLIAGYFPKARPTPDGGPGGGKASDPSSMH